MSAGDRERAEDYARRYIASIRAWGEVVFQAGLDQSRTSVQRTEILAKLWGKCEARVAKAPEGYAGDFVQAYMRISKNK